MKKIKVILVSFFSLSMLVLMVYSVLELRKDYYYPQYPSQYPIKGTFVSMQESWLPFFDRIEITYIDSTTQRSKKFYIRNNYWHHIDIQYEDQSGYQNIRIVQLPLNVSFTKELAFLSLDSTAILVGGKLEMLKEELLNNGRPFSSDMSYSAADSTQSLYHFRYLY